VTESKPVDLRNWWPDHWLRSDQLSEKIIVRRPQKINGTIEINGSIMIRMGRGIECCSRFSKIFKASNGVKSNAEEV